MAKQLTTLEFLYITHMVLVATKQHRCTQEQGSSILVFLGTHAMNYIWALDARTTDAAFRRMVVNCIQADVQRHSRKMQQAMAIMAPFLQACAPSAQPQPQLPLPTCVV